MQAAAINYLAVVVAALAAFVVGALWYSPLLFAKQWVRAHGHTPEKLQEMQKTANRAYLVSVLCFLVMAFVFALVMSFAGVVTVAQGVLLGFLIWLGFAFTIGLTAVMYSNKPISAFLIDAGYQFVYLLLMGAILGGWR